MLDGIVPPALVIAAAIAMFAAGRAATRRHRPDWRTDLVIALGVAAVTAGLELAMGRSIAYDHGPVRLWIADVNSDQNSQQLTDPYTFSHIIHGALFYGVTHLLLPRASIGARLLVALTIEGAWETYENTDTVINRYRATTIALGYYGIPYSTRSRISPRACSGSCSRAAAGGGGPSRGSSRSNSPWRSRFATTSR